MAPQTLQDWLAVARERAADADTLIASREVSTGSVYMAGYAVECSLKAYLLHQGKGFPRSGPSGHDLKSLWAKAGFQLSDLRDSQGHKTFYIEEWSTALRYEIEMTAPSTAAQRVQGARELSSWLQTRMKRSTRASRRRRG